MIRYIKGNLLGCKSQALVNAVNTVGVMGKGIALQFKKAFPKNFEAYAAACKSGQIDIGRLFVFADSNAELGDKTIINFPTKKHWRDPSEYSYVVEGLDDLVRILNEGKITSIAIPPLGCGLGGLEWAKVKKMIEEKLSGVDVDIFVYEPTGA